MLSRLFAFAAVLAILSSIGLWRMERTAAGQVTNPQPAPAADVLQQVTLVFGAKDMTPAKWDGSASLSQGRIEKILGYHFTETSKLLAGNAWECETHPWAPFTAGMHPDERPQPQPTPVQAIGVTIQFRAPADAEFRITVPKGAFGFRPMDVPSESSIFPLNATVEVCRSPVVEQVTDNAYEDDYPSLAVDGGTRYLAWQGYRDEADQVLLRRYRDGRWSERVTVSEKPADIFSTAIAARNGAATVVWSERDGAVWNLKSRRYEGDRAGAVQTITRGEGNNLFQRVAADQAGNVYVAYQSWRKGRSDIYLRSARAAGKWGPEINLSDSARGPRANDWNPAVAADRKGNVWVAWDGYGAGSYNIYLRSVREGKAGPLIPVTASTRFHAHPSVAIDAQDRLWIAWDEAPENWGKDTGFLLSGGTGLYDSRAIQIAVYNAGAWSAPLRQPAEVVPYGFRRYFQTPRLVADNEGGMWLIARPRTSARLPTSLWAAGGKWEIAATHYAGDRWSELKMIPDTVGRNEGPLEAAAGDNGEVYVAMVSDHRLWGGPNFGSAPRNNDVMFTTLRAERGTAMNLGKRGIEAPGAPTTEPGEKRQIAAVRQYAIRNDGKTYHIYRGDMHRHTDISADGAGDGSLFDAYRYMMDAAGMDYFAVTDHQSGTQEYTWWRTQKSADMFHVAGFFTALFGTERSLAYPNGHRNLMFAQRGVHILPITPEEQKSNTGPRLYPYLKENRGIAMSHTSHTTMGTDWRDNDPALEPLVEIYQGARTSAEHEGAPLAPTEKRTELHAGGYRPLGYVWNAWAKGYKLGVQASSDHVSTHISYACLIAEEGTREGLLEAMRRRHSYAATANIVMDYRAAADGKTFLQGDAFTADGLPEFTAKIVGTAPLKKVVLVRDNQYIYSQEPAGEQFDLRYRENTLAAGEHYYYLRAEQKDGNVAWSSPVWITRR